MVYEDDKDDIEKKLGVLVHDTVIHTSDELTGDKQLEKQMKKSCLKNQQQWSNINILLFS